MTMGGAGLSLSAAMSKGEQAIAMARMEAVFMMEKLPANLSCGNWDGIR
jgi:hypothetical protein